MTDTITFKKIHEDSRGSIFVVSYHSKDYEMFELKKGSVRGGHYHKSAAIQFVLHGKVLYQEIDAHLTYHPSLERRVTLASGDSLKTPAGTAHLVTAIEDSLMIELREGEYEITNYPPYRNLVEEYLSRQ